MTPPFTPTAIGSRGEIGEPGARGEQGGEFGLEGREDGSIGLMLAGRPSPLSGGLSFEITLKKNENKLFSLSKEIPQKKKNEFRLNSISPC